VCKFLLGEWLWKTSRSCSSRRSRTHAEGFGECYHPNMLRRVAFPGSVKGCISLQAASLTSPTTGASWSQTLRRFIWKRLGNSKSGK